MLSLENLLALEHAGWGSRTNGTGGTFYGEVMTEGGVMILVNGIVMSRDAVAGGLNQAPPWDSYEIVEPRLIPLTDQAATLIYRSSSRRGRTFSRRLCRAPTCSSTAPPCSPCTSRPPSHIRLRPFPQRSRDSHFATNCELKCQTANQSANFNQAFRSLIHT